MIIFRVLFIVIIITVTACAGTSPKLSAKDVAQYRQEQSIWMSNLEKGISPEMALNKVADYQHYFFKYIHDGKIYLYSQGKFPGTGTLFGLLFEDRKLRNLLLDQSVTDFALCRKYSYQSSWPYKSFTENIAWISENSRIGKHYDAINMVSPDYVQKNNNKSTDNVVEVITHLPLAIIALPLYGSYKMMGFPLEDKNKLGAAISYVTPGTTTSTQLKKTLGKPPPGYKSTNKEMEVWRYDSVRFHIINGVVSFMESTNWHHIPLNSLTVIRDIKCHR